MKKGFTLIELLAVIIILAILLAIAIPGMGKIIESSTKASAQSDAMMVLKAIEYQQLQNDSFDPTTINETTVNTILGLDNSNYQSVTVKVMNGKNYITIVGKNKWHDLTISGTRTIMNVSDTVTTYSNGANAPVLATGMTPIKWNSDTNNWDTVSDPAADTSWYNYDTTNKIWANTRTADGSMWVWIPRYIYRISSGWHSNTVGTIDIQFSRGVDDNWNKGTIGAIDVGETANASNNKWTNHPAFTFGDTEVTGIWVAKFEASNSSGNVKIVQDVASWRAISVNDIFTKVRSMETNNVYGWGTTGTGIDTHMMANDEWGAVAYLSKSTYGLNSEIYKNNSNDYITGRSGGNIGGSQIIVGGNEYIDTGFYTYDGKCASTTTLAPGIDANCSAVGNAVSDISLSYKASTTGNIYGIYDMSGGAWEYTSSYVNDGHANLATNGNSIYTAESKYKNVYPVASTYTAANNYLMAVSSKGDAIYETSNASIGTTSWYGDYSYMVNVDNPWFQRGGTSYYTSSTGTFGFHRYTGGAGGGNGFRPVMVVGAGL